MYLIQGFQPPSFPQLPKTCNSLIRFTILYHYAVNTLRVVQSGSPQLRRSKSDKKKFQIYKAQGSTKFCTNSISQTNLDENHVQISKNQAKSYQEECFVQTQTVSGKHKKTHQLENQFTHFHGQCLGNKLQFQTDKYLLEPCLTPQRRDCQLSLRWHLVQSDVRCPALHYEALSYTVHCTALYWIMLHCTALYCTTQHCTALHRIALQ